MLVLTINALLFTCFFLCKTAAVEIDLRVDKTNWVDPTDPLSRIGILDGNSILNKEHNKMNANEELEKCIQQYEKVYQELQMLRTNRANSVDTLMKHILRQFLDKLNINLRENGPIFKKAQVTLSKDDLSIIKRYLSSEKAVEEFGLREHLRSALEHFLVETDIRSDNSLFSFLHSLLPYLLVLNIIILMPATLVFLNSFSNKRQLFGFLFLSIFCWSYYATYMRKYKEILAERFLRTNASLKEGKNPCTPQGLISEAFDVMLSYVRIKDKNECLKSHEDELIEPFLQVDPLQVLAEVLSNFFLGGLPTSGTYLNSFFNNFFINTPIHLALIKVLFVFGMPIFVIYIIYLYARSNPMQYNQQKPTEVRRIRPKTTSTPAISRTNSQVDLTGSDTEANQ